MKDTRRFGNRYPRCEHCGRKVQIQIECCQGHRWWVPAAGYDEGDRSVGLWPGHEPSQDERHALCPECGEEYDQILNEHPM